MSWTVLVRSPVMPQWGNITVTAPSVTSIPAWYYDWSETLTANSWATPPAITNTWWFVANYEENAFVAPILNYKSSYLDISWRYFLICSEYVMTWTQRVNYLLFELDTGTDTWIDRTKVSWATVNIIGNTRVFERTGNIWIRMVTQSDNAPLNYVTFDYTFSTNTRTWPISFNPFVDPYPWVWLTEILINTYDAIWWYTYVPYRSTWTAFWWVNEWSSIFTVSVQ